MNIWIIIVNKIIFNNASFDFFEWILSLLLARNIIHLNSYIVYCNEIMWFEKMQENVRKDIRKFLFYEIFFKLNMQF